MDNNRTAYALGPEDGEALWGFGSLWTVKASAEQTGGSFALVAGHETNPEIAKRLHLSQKTVRNHVSNIFTKLQVADRAQAIIRAREAGLGGNAADRF